jgi:hypothetical protein
MKRTVLLLASLFFVISMPIWGAVGDFSVVKEASAQTTRFDSPPPYEEDGDTPPPVEENDYTGQEAAEPPPMEFAEPPDVVVVPSGTSYVYMVPDTPGFYFYHGNWYRNYRGAWFRSPSYEGPWDFVEASFVPRVVVDVPLEYVLFLPVDYHRIHYRDLHRSWRSWDQGRHWSRQAWFKHELRDDIRRERFGRIRAEREKSRHSEDRRSKRLDTHDRRDHDRPATERDRRDLSTQKGINRLKGDDKKAESNRRDRASGNTRDLSNQNRIIRRKSGDKEAEGNRRDGASGNARDLSTQKRINRLKGTDKDTGSVKKDMSSSDKGTRAVQDRQKSGDTNVQKSHNNQEEKDPKKRDR